MAYEDFFLDDGTARHVGKDGTEDTLASLESLESKLQRNQQSSDRCQWIQAYAKGCLRVVLDAGVPASSKAMLIARGRAYARELHDESFARRVTEVFLDEASERM